MVVQNKYTNFCLLLVLLLAIWGCSKEKTFHPRQYVTWVEDPANGLRISKELSPYEFTIQYKPLDYVVAMEERTETLATSFLAERKAELGDNLDYFNFRIAISGSKKNVLMQAARDEQEYYQLIDYLSYAAQEDFYLIDGADTAKCVLYSFVRNYELTPYLDFALGFERIPNRDKTFVFDDKMLRTGIIKAEIKQQKIDKLPKLKTN